MSLEPQKKVRKRVELKKIFKEIMAECFQNLTKVINLHSQNSVQKLNKINSKKSTSRYIITILQKTETKKHLESNKGDDILPTGEKQFKLTADSSSECSRRNIFPALKEKTCQS